MKEKVLLSLGSGIVAVAFVALGFFAGSSTAVPSNPNSSLAALAINANPSGTGSVPYQCVSDDNVVDIDNDFSDPSSYILIDADDTEYRCTIVIAAVIDPARVENLMTTKMDSSVRQAAAPAAKTPVRSLQGSMTTTTPPVATRASVEGLGGAQPGVPVIYACTRSSDNLTHNTTYDFGPNGGPSSFTTTTPTGTWKCVKAISQAPRQGNDR